VDERSGEVRVVRVVCAQDMGIVVNPLGAVIANAIFDATGARVRRMPMTPERVREALAAR